MPISTRVFGIIALAISICTIGFYVGLIGIVPSLVIIASKDSVSEFINKYNYIKYLDRINDIHIRAGAVLFINLLAIAITLFALFFIIYLVFIVLAWLVIGYFYFSGNSSGNANAGGASAPAARPNVIFVDPNMAVGEMRMEKTGEWTIRFGRRDHPTADLMTIRPSTVEGNAGGGFKVYWS